MKNKILLIVLSCMLLGSVVRGQYVNIPDSNFRNFLMVQYPSCFNGAKQLDTTCSLILTATSIPIGYFADCRYQLNAKNFTGLKYFKSLRELDLSTLYNLVFPIELPKSLRKLDLSYSLNHNHLFDMSTLDSLNTFICINCDTVPLNFSNSLKIISVMGSKTITLPKLPDSLQTLYCSGTNIKCLPYLPITLQSIYASFGWFGGSTVPTMCLPNYPNSTCKYYQPYNVNCHSGGGCWCIQTWGGQTAFQVYPKLCSPVKNCERFTPLQAFAFHDLNSNNKYDNNELLAKNIKISLSNNNFAYTNASGIASIATDSLGTYTITATPPNLYNVVPPSYTHNFNSYDTMVIDTFALQPSVLKDSISIKLSPTNWAARIGRSYLFLVSYENVGTTVLSNAAISLNYNNSLLNYDSSSVGAVANSGSSLSLNIGNIVPGQTGSFVAYFKVKTTAVLNSSFTSVANITTNTVSAIDTVQTIIRSSYDPNDKEATPELTTIQIANGTDIDYTIRFQNTGTDTAFHVVIADTLSSLLQANTLEMVESSHNCKTTVKEGIAYFEMRDILLPDSNINEIKSHGFVRFKVKPASTLINGDSVNNKASIYFDYNKSVLTNTATTKIKNPVIVPLELISFDGNALENGSNELHWNTANEINTSGFAIQRSVDGRVFASIGEVVANGKGSYGFTDNRVPLTAFYRLMIKDNDGSFSFSKFIVIKSEMRNQKFEILSNPVKDKLVLSNLSNSLINTEAGLINSAGVVVKRFVIHAATETINMRGFEAGVYYLRTVEGSRKIMISY